MKKLLSLILVITFLISMMLTVSTNFYYEISKINGKNKYASTNISQPQNDYRSLEKIAEKEDL